MGSMWDLLITAADLVAWMARNGIPPIDYSPPDEWTFPCLIGAMAAEAMADGKVSWVIVDMTDALKLVAARPARPLGVQATFCCCGMDPRDCACRSSGRER